MKMPQQLNLANPVVLILLDMAIGPSLMSNIDIDTRCVTSNMYVAQ